MLVYQIFQRGYRLHTSESDVNRRQILTYEDGTRSKELNYNTGIQMKRKKLTKTFVIISI